MPALTQLGGVLPNFCARCYGVQFFVSKKRKPTSPGFKSGRSKKHVKATFEGSPGAKGTLDNCLVTSKDDNSPRSSHTAHDSLAGPDAVRRNLALEEIHNSSKDEVKQPFFSEELHPATSEAIEVAQNEASHGVSLMGDAAVGNLTKGCSEFPHGAADNSDLKKFAADFLSLYCRYCTLNIRNHLYLHHLLMIGLAFLIGAFF